MYRISYTPKTAMGMNVGNNLHSILSSHLPDSLSIYIGSPHWDMLLSTSYMEGIRKVDELVAHLGIPRRDILLPCTFCARFLTPDDLLHFEWSGMQLIWRLGNVFGCCCRCARTCSSLENIQHFVRTASLEDIERELRKPIAEVKVRCRRCLHPLSYVEKLQCAERGESFVKIRQGWRGSCSLCKTP